jgi:hypothetical protein
MLVFLGGRGDVRTLMLSMRVVKPLASEEAAARLLLNEL